MKDSSHGKLWYLPWCPQILAQGGDYLLIAGGHNSTNSLIKNVSLLISHFLQFACQRRFRRSQYR